MEDNTDAEYTSIGGNRHPSAADWDRDGSQLLAFGAGNSIALWNPSVRSFADINQDFSLT